MDLKRWAICLMSSLLTFGLVAAEVKEEKKKEEHKEKKAEKKEEKKDEHKSKALPEPIFKAFNARYKNAEVLEVKTKEGNTEISAKDQWNEKYKVVYAADAKLVSESSHKLPLANVPSAVVDTAKKWAPAAKWNDVAEVSAKQGEAPAYEITGDLNGKNIKAEIAEDGKVIKADKLPEAKTEKKEVKKEVKHEEKKAEKKVEEKK